VPTDREQHLAAIRAALTTDAEREFFDAAVARWRNPGEGAAAEMNRKGAARVATLTVAEAVESLRREMPRTALKPFLCDDPGSMLDVAGYDLDGEGA
jgi:hypothetical protein